MNNLQRVFLFACLSQYVQSTYEMTFLREFPADLATNSQKIACIVGSLGLCWRKERIEKCNDNMIVIIPSPAVISFLFPHWSSLPKYKYHWKSSFIRSFKETEQHGRSYVNNDSYKYLSSIVTVVFFDMVDICLIYDLYRSDNWHSRSCRNSSCCGSCNK